MGEDRDRNRDAQHDERDREVQRDDGGVLVRGDDPAADRGLDHEERGEPHREPCREPRNRSSVPLPLVARPSEGPRADDGEGDRQARRNDGEQPMEVLDEGVVFDAGDP